MKKILSDIAVIGTLLMTVTCLAEAGTSTVSLTDCSNEAFNNICLAAEAIDGTELDCGDLFSFNEIVGPRSAANGYQTALNGRGVAVTGGGVARVASALCLALRDSGADITYRDRYTYGSRYKGNYVTDSNDAILVDYASGIDFSFLSNENSVTISMDVTTDTLKCTVEYGNESDNVALPDLSFSSFRLSDESLSSSSMIDVSEDNTEQLANIDLAVKCIDGTILSPGEVFSFNGIVGPRTEKRGYVSAENGRGARVVGGGVAQVASAVWLAVKQVDDISVIQRSTYGSKYNQSYVSSSNDAILTDYQSGIDFSFMNNGDRDVTISVFLSDNVLTCEILY